MNGRDIWRLKTYSTQIIFTSTVNYDKFETIIINLNKYYADNWSLLEIC